MLDLVGIAAIACNAPKLAATATDPDRERVETGRSAAYNIWGLSQLMLGNDENVATAFEIGRRSGTPVAAPAVLFPAIAHYRLGNTDRANAMMAELRATWPDFPARFLTQRVFPLDLETRDYVFSVLQKYGY